ncbi:MAG: histidine phosphatase family protein [Aggregatilineales bacterium]
MRILEHRRHSIRTKPSPHLNQEGVSLARQVGEQMGRFALVVTSTLPRAYETAIAMGYAVHEQREQLAHMPEAVDRELNHPMTFADYMAVVRRGGAAARYATKQAELLRELIERLREGEAALVVSHGSIVELSAVGALPEADLSAWGGELGCCEGVRLFYEGGVFVRGEVLRLS